MADGVSFDFSEITRLVADIDKAPTAMAINVAKAVEVTARQVKDDWQEPLKGSESLPGGAAAVTYEMQFGASILKSAISAEIGPELKGQGPIVGMLEFGTPNTGARGYGAEALRKNQEDFVEGIGKAGDVL